MILVEFVTIRMKCNHDSNGFALNGTVKRTDSSEDLIPKPMTPENSLLVPNFRFSQAAVLVFTVSVLCFCVSYDGQFIYDDRRAILKNKDLLPETPLSNLLVNDFWGNEMKGKTSHKSYRPVTVLSFRLSYYLGGGHSPAWFHIPNIIIHGLVSVPLLRVFSILFGGYQVDRESRELRFRSAKSSILCALLFAVHPVHTESVSANVGRADLLCCLSFLLSFLMYAKACALDLDENNNKVEVYRPTRFSVPCILGSMFMCFVSVLCKEQGITVIGVCSVYDIICVCELDPHCFYHVTTIDSSGETIGQTCGKKASFTDPWILSLIKRHVFLVTTGVLIMVFRYGMMGTHPPYFLYFDNPHSFQNGTLIRGLSYNYLYSVHAWLLVHPWWLCFDWSMGSIPVFESCFDVRLISAVAVWMVIGALLWTCLKRPTTKDQRILTMALALIVIPFLPASNVFFRVGFVVAERILYLSSIGFCMLIVLGIRHVCARYPELAQIVHWGFVCLVMIFILRCIQRSSEWRNAMDLYKSGAKVCPLNAKIHYNIGKMASDSGDTVLAEDRYRAALKLNPVYAGALNNLGLLLSEKGEIEEAEILLRRAIEVEHNPVYANALNNLGLLLSKKGKMKEAEILLRRATEVEKSYASAWSNLGMVQRALKKYDEAERSFMTALRYQPKHAQCYTNLGNLYIELNKLDKAVDAWTKAASIEPTLSSPWTNMAFQLDVYGRYADSIEVSERGLRHLPGNSQLHFNLGNVYGKTEQWLESEKHYLTAIKLNPSNALYYANFGVLYARWGKYELAEQNYQKALAINPKEPNAKNNLALLNKKQK